MTSSGGMQFYFASQRRESTEKSGTSATSTDYKDTHKSEKQDAPKISAKHLHIICFLLHIIFIGFHAILLIVCSLQLERGLIKTDPTEIARMSLAKTLASQTVAIIYLTVVLYVTQRVALASAIPRDSVSILHDKQLSWSGLGAATSTLAQQFWTATSPSGIASITLYLLFSAGLKITTPALFDVVPVTVSHPTSASAFMGSMNVSNLNLSDDLLQQAAGIAPQLNKNRRAGMSAIGLQGNLIYPQLNPTLGKGELNMSASAVHVQCSAVKVPSVSRNSTTDESPASYGISLNGNASANWHSMALNTIKKAQSGNGTLWVLTLPIEDSQGARAPTAQVLPPMNSIFDNIALSPLRDESLPEVDSKARDFREYEKAIPFEWDGFRVADVPEVTLLTCSLKTSDLVVTVDVQTRTLISSPERSSHRVWDDARTDLQSLDAGWEKLFNVPDSAVLSGSAVCRQSPRLSVSVLNRTSVVIDKFNCAYLTLGEKYIMDTLNLEPFQLTEHPSISFNTGSEPADFPAPVRKTIKLHEFEQALENYTAAMLWSIGQSGRVLSGQSKLVEIRIPELGAQLQLVRLPIIVGLCLSIGLLILTPLITMPSFSLAATKRTERSTMSTLGVLETIWLSRNDPRFVDAGEAMEKVTVPLVHNLRKALGSEIDEEGERFLTRAESTLARRSPRTGDDR